MDNLNWSGVVVLCVVVALVSGFVGYQFAPSETTGLTNAECMVKTSDAVNQSAYTKNTEIERLKRICLEEKGNETDETETEELGYLIDELYLSEPLEDTYSDREVKTLFDGEVDFDGKDYDAEETLILKDIELLANEKDFEGNVYMVVPKRAIEYKIEFESDLNTSLIDDEETLSFSFLGDELEVSSWSDDSVVFFKGEVYELDEGESVTIDEMVVTLQFTGDDSAHISVDGDSKEIKEGKIKTIGELQVKVEYSFETTNFRVGGAKLIISEDIENEVYGGGEYEEDSAWDWVIDSNSIGIVLVEDFTEVDLDGDEEFQAVGVDKKLCLPNEYVCVQFNGMDELDTEEYSLELDERDGNEYVRIKGNFISGIEDFDKIYVNTTGIYDKNLELIDDEEIELANTDSILNISTGDLVFEDFTVNMDLEDSEANGNDLNSEEEDWLTNFGLKILDPENGAEDQEFEISVPEEQLEGSITLI